jgi:molybdopterin molybdotransferase
MSTELFTVRPPAEAWTIFAQRFTPIVRTERISTSQSLGRVLAETIASPQDLPEFPRSTVDGYAVNAADAYGATPGLPALLAVVGEALMGQASTTPVGVGEAVLMHTGGMLPPNANAVVMVEQTQRVDATSIEVFKPVAEGENVVQVGEDVRQGETIFAPGQRMRPQDIGALMALGVTEITVAARPRIAILSTGDEVISPEQTPQPGQVRDVNSYSLAALSLRAGALPLNFPIIPDRRAALAAAAHEAKAAADIVVFSAGSSVSYRDMTVDVIQEMGTPGVLVHGVSVKPGKPTILAVCDGTPVFGLPGNPVSAMVIFDLFVAPTICALLGAQPLPKRQMRARLVRNIASVTGREDYVAVRLEARAGEPWAIPVLGKSNLIYTLVHSEGTVVVPLDANGLAAGEWVDVWLD